MATENRSNNCKNQTSNRTSNQTSNRTSNQTSNSATNEHKHPNQYTKGAAALRHCFPVRKAAGFRVYFSLGSNCCHRVSNSSCTRLS